MTISGLCKLTVIADKRATVQSTVVTKTCSSLISCSLIHEVSVLHVWECDAMTQNVVKKLADQKGVNRLFDMISQSDMLSFYGTEKKYILKVQRTVRNEEDKTSFSLGCSAESLELVFCQTSWHNLRGLLTLHN